MLLYLISKVLPNFLLPLGLSIILLALIRKKKWNIYGVLFLLLFFSNAIVSQLLWQLLEREQKVKSVEPLNKTEFVVVLGGGIVEPGLTPNSLNWTDPDKFMAGLEIISKNKAKKLILFRSANPFDNFFELSEGQLLRKYAIERGIDQKNIILTKKVYKTLDEAKEVEIILNLESNNSKKIILVTNAYHMDRAKYIFESKGIKVEPFPVNFKSVKIKKELFLNPLSYIPSVKYLYDTSVALRELLGNLVYSLVIRK
tara:strand:+ start:7089 stop:7856 length:768 start_codon:yes stop_codon:yes gene_type:complete